MMNAIEAYKEAIRNYKTHLVDYAIYSFIACLVGGIVFTMMLAVFSAMGILSVGTAVNFFAANSGVNVVGFLVLLLIIFVGFLLFAWVSAGINGAYLATVYGFLSLRKQTLVHFFALIPKYGTSLIAVSMLCGLVIVLPVLALSFLAYSLNSLISLVVIGAALVYGFISSMLLIFSMPGVVVDNKRALASVANGIAFSVRNILAVFVFIFIAALLAIPNFFVIITPIYLPFFYLPIVTAALLALYKNAHKH